VTKKDVISSGISTEKLTCRSVDGCMNPSVWA